MTGHHQGPKCKLWAGHRALSLKCTSCCNHFSLSSVVLVSRAFSALCVYSKFGHHPHPLGYLCAKFRSFCSLHCRASRWRKTAYSITQSPSLFDAPGTKACTSEKLVTKATAILKQLNNVATSSLIAYVKYCGITKQSSMYAMICLPISP